MKEPQIARALDFVKRFGSNSVSFQILKSGFKYEFNNNSSCLGYVDTGHAWIAAGEPLCPPTEYSLTALAFTKAAKCHGRRSAFFATREYTLDADQFERIPIGDEAILDAQHWREESDKNKNFKEQIRRAQVKGVKVQRIDPAQLSQKSHFRKQFDLLIKQWSTSKKMGSLGFLTKIDPFLFSAECFYLLARQDTKAIGLLIAVPVYEQNGWLIEHILRTPTAPNGTTELLINTAMCIIEDAGQRNVSLGLTPLYQDVSAELRITRCMFQGFYDFKGLRTFKYKMPTVKFKPLFIDYPKTQGRLSTYIDVADAFIPQGWFAFGLDTVTRLPSPFLVLLTITTLIWTAFVASMKTTIWFPSFGAKIVWVSFDLCIAYGFWRLSRRLQKKVLDVLTLAISADVLLTMLQIFFFNLKHVHSAYQYSILLLAVLAPMMTTYLLWTASLRLKEADSTASKIKRF